MVKLGKAINQVAKFSEYHSEACTKGINNTPVYKENSSKFLKDDGTLMQTGKKWIQQKKERLHKKKIQKFQADGFLAARIDPMKGIFFRIQYIIYLSLL